MARSRSDRTWGRAFPIFAYGRLRHDELLARNETATAEARKPMSGDAAELVPSFQPVGKGEIGPATPRAGANRQMLSGT